MLEKKLLLLRWCHILDFSLTSFTHRDCVEKLQLLSTPEEHIRRLNEVPDVHADPKMDPDYEFTEDDEDLNSERQEKNKTLKYSFKDEDEFPIRRVGSASRKNSDVAGDSNRSALKAGVQGVVSPTVPPVRTDGPSRTQGHACEVSSPKSPKANVNVNGSNSCILKNSQPVIEPAQISVTQPQTAPQPPSTNAVSLNNLSETDKFWHYQDPADFSMAQLRKWSSNGFFPTNLRIWRTSEKQQESMTEDRPLFYQNISCILADVLSKIIEQVTARVHEDFQTHLKPQLLKEIKALVRDSKRQSPPLPDGDSGPLS